VRQEAAEDLGEGAYLGGPYSTPTYLVICEWGGNYRALNQSSMAGGAYQIIPSTWQAYGGTGQYAHLASKAEQDRVAAIIWREDGPGAWSCD
jgi:muramidase (phage lysozyme)